MTEQLFDFERQVLEKILAGENLVLQELRVQLDNIKVSKRELTGVGFYIYFSVNSSLIKKHLIGKTFRVSDVFADIEGLKYGAGFVLFVKNGAIDTLEGYSFDEPWPEKTLNFRLYYLKEDARDISLD